MGDLGVQGKKMPGSIEIGTDRLVRFSIPEQPRFEPGELLTGRFRKKVCGQSSFLIVLSYLSVFEKYFIAGNKKCKRKPENTLLMRERKGEKQNIRRRHGTSPADDYIAVYDWNGTGNAFRICSVVLR